MKSDQRDNMKLAIVTYSNSDIGTATINLLVHKGFIVFGLDNSYQNEGLYRGVVQMKVDLLNAKAVKQVIEQILEMYGHIDLLICNTSMESVHSVDVLKKAQEVFICSFFSVCNIVQYVLPILQQQNYGMIVGVSSLIGELPNHYKSYFVASKAALSAYFISTLNDLKGSEVRMSVVHPSSIRAKQRKTTEKFNKQIDYQDEDEHSFNAKKSAKISQQKSILDAAKTVIRASFSKSPLPVYTVGIDELQ
ncbi:MAG: SDR family NAD(P)-dependent oxidoreductase [Clostridiales bacterium]|jgi:NADP-dependent 3-hydroxy acid dehydrogenase YdfG|nr:SDR family NAD(P)-dependent oxidoreductase [Clostridiales bacterium]